MPKKIKFNVISEEAMEAKKKKKARPFIKLTSFPKKPKFNVKKAPAKKKKKKKIKNIYYNL